VSIPAPAMPDAAPSRRAPRWALALRRFDDWALFDAGGGARPLKLAWVINLQKGASLPFFALMMALYADRTPWATSAPAWTYLALHGSYGLVWLLKDFAFPDANWQRRCTWGSALIAAIGLAGYWSIGWVLISGVSSPRYPLSEPAWLALCIGLCIAGVAIMLAADVQKYVQLRARRGLITTGMFRWVRHPNYLGEMMIYGSFALLAWHWLPLLVLATFWLGLFAPNMALKEASMSRYPEWAAYERRSWWLVPGVL
jgi:protein-S-isoprenylcysteine O-methyltransferase Ste14